MHTRVRACTEAAFQATVYSPSSRLNSLPVSQSLVPHCLVTCKLPHHTGPHLGPAACKLGFV